jgi:hypothetical protein
MCPTSHSGLSLILSSFPFFRKQVRVLVRKWLKDADGNESGKRLAVVKIDR